MPAPPSDLEYSLNIQFMTMPRVLPDRQLKMLRHRDKNEIVTVIEYSIASGLCWEYFKSNLKGSGDLYSCGKKLCNHI